jgi:hypothetical protein
MPGDVMKKNALQSAWSFVQTFRRALAWIWILILSEKGFTQNWSSVGGGLNDWANATAVYKGELIVGGRFTGAGGIAANHIARWNGTRWDSLGRGLDGWVNALTVYNGELIAGGSFTSAGGLTVNNVARWDGAAWTDASGGTNSIVAALTVFDNKLIAGGYFVDAEGLTLNHIGAWDGSGWAPLAGGTGGTQGQVMALGVYGSRLIAAGFFTTAGGAGANHIAQWDGSAWSPLGDGVNWIVYSLANYGADLIAGGLFATAGGVAANSIARWNGGTWDALDGGMGATAVGYNYVFALTVYNGALFAGGMFLRAGGVTANGIAKWNGSAWSDLDGGVYYGGSNAYGVNTLIVYANELIAGGLFTTAGSAGVAHLAGWKEPASPVAAAGDPPRCFRLGQNHPNPFNPSTVIPFDLLRPARATLTIHDRAGRAVRTLADEQKTPGHYELRFDAAGLPSGVYFCRLQAGGFFETRKLILLR